MDLLINLLFLGVGGVVTWQVAERYYKAAGLELKGEAERLRRQSNMILTMLENPGIKCVRNDVGEVEALEFRFEVKPGKISIKGQNVPFSLGKAQE